MTIIYSGFTHWKRWLSIAFCRFTRPGTPFLSFSRFPCLTETDGHHCHVNVTVLKQLKACRFTWPIHTNSIFSWLGTFPLLKSVEYNSSKLSNWSTYTTCAPATRPTWPPQPCLKGVSPSARTSEGRIVAKIPRQAMIYGYDMLSGWWLQPRWKIWKSMRRIIHIFWKKECMFQTTKQSLLTNHH